MKSAAPGAGLAILALLCSCAPAVVPAPRGPAARPMPSPTPPPVALGQDWQDWPVAPGNWSYAHTAGGTVARYGLAGAAPVLWLRCDLATHGVTLVRAEAGSRASAMMTLRTSYGVLQWPAQAVGGDGSGDGPGLGATRAANDSGLDWLLYSRGHFTVEMPDTPPMVVPTWAEPARVVEDCRG